MTFRFSFTSCSAWVFRINWTSSKYIIIYNLLFSINILDTVHILVLDVDYFFFLVFEDMFFFRVIFFYIVRIVYQFLFWWVFPADWVLNRVARSFYSRVLAPASKRTSKPLPGDASSIFRCPYYNPHIHKRRILYKWISTSLLLLFFPYPLPKYPGHDHKDIRPIINYQQNKFKYSKITPLHHPSYFFLPSKNFWDNLILV